MTKKYGWFKTERKTGTILLRPMGFEFTFEKKGNDWYEFTKDEEIIFVLNALGIAAYQDNGCLEINSPIFKYMEDVLDYWEFLKNVLKRFNVHPRNKTSTGGGTHIHIGISKTICGKQTVRDLVFRKNLIKIVWNRPWLTWAFQDPSDDYSSEAICSECTDVYLKGRIQQGKLRYIFGGKGCSIRDKMETKTVELRFFDTTTSRKDLKDYIKVANHLVKIALEKTESMIPVKNESQLYRMLIKNKGLQEYKKFLKEVGINHTTEKIKMRARFCRQLGKLKHPLEFQFQTITIG